ncbi:HNH endonuclease [Psychrobacter sp. Ps4]
MPATDVDHIINKAKGGSDEPSNLQSLCRKCHLSKTANE